MRNMQAGTGHHPVIDYAKLPEKLSTRILQRNTESALIPSIAHASADWDDDLVAGSKVKFFRENEIITKWFQDVQINEDPETHHHSLECEEVEILGEKSWDIKLSKREQRALQVQGLEAPYFQTLESRMVKGLEMLYDESHLAHMITGASAINTGNRAHGQFDLGSPDNPIVIPRSFQQAEPIVEQVITNLQLALQLQNAMTTNGETALIMPTLFANKAQSLFTDHNTCCGKDNIRVTGNMSKTIYGFDTFQTNRQVMSVLHNGRRIYYVIASDKKASGFVADCYGFEWYKGKFDQHLVGTTVFGSYVTQPDQIAIATITFE